MEKVCVCCREKTQITDIDVSVKISHRQYSTRVVALTCPKCLGNKVDPNELSAYKVGIAMRRISEGRLTGRDFSCCRKAIRLNLDDAARDLTVSAECLLGIEEAHFPVPLRMHEYLAYRIRRAFDTLAFLPRPKADRTCRPWVRMFFF